MTGKKRARTPTVLQMEAVECGAASLCIVLACFKRYVPLEKLRYDCGVTRDGSKANNILKAARKYGLDAKGFKLAPEKLVEQDMPVIVWWNQNHFLVLEGIRNGVCYLNDPASGPRTCSFEEFDDSYSRITMTFERSPEFEPGGTAPSVLAGLLPRMVPYRMAAAFFIISALFLVIPGLAMPAFTQVFIDEIVVANRDDWLRPLLVVMAVIALLTYLLTALQEYYLLRYQTVLALSDSARFFHHILRLPTSFFSQRFGGEIGQRVQINDRIAEIVAAKLSHAVVDFLQTAFFALLMFFYDGLLASVTIFLGLLNFVVVKLVARFRVDACRRLLKDEGKLLGTAMGGLQMIETIKGTGGDDEFFARWSGYQAKTLTAKQQLGFAAKTTAALPTLLNAFTTVAILGVGGYQVMEGHLTIGMLVAFQTIASNFSHPFSSLVAVSGEIQELQGDMARIDDVLNHNIDPLYEHTEAKKPDQPKLSGLVEIKNITFGYNPLGKPLIDDFSLSIGPGQRVALVGGSGSGKSTVAKIVSGLYQPWSGNISFDGYSRQELDPDYLNNSVAVIDQEVFLFEGTVLDNVTMWDATVPELQVTAALRDAAMLEIISARPGGMLSHVEEGGRNFSGGQRQRLEIARALLSEPRFIILDEATSALDPPTEKEIEKNLMRRGCSCLIVAHRLSTIRDCDEIIVMKNGKVIERGPHEELVKLNGAYCELIKE
jgi:NHLM bacteriocin system ABC transporter peptidase/ATP-binding protein